MPSPAKKKAPSKRGGRRPGAGRPRGSGKAKPKSPTANLDEQVRKDLKKAGIELNEVAAGEKDPIEFLKTVMASTEVPFHHRMDAAKTVAPYCSPKLTHQTSRPGDHSNDPASIPDSELAGIIRPVEGTGGDAPPAKKKRAA